MKLGRQLVIAGIAMSALGVAKQAGAAAARFSGDDARLTLDEAGWARVEHAITYRVTGALPKEFDLAGVEAEAALDPLAPITLDGEPAGDARVERKAERALHVTLDGPSRRASGHTTLVVRVRYAVDLVKARLLTLDGAMWRLDWTAPAAVEGYDDARLVLDLPAAPTEPRLLAGTGEEDGRAVTLRRRADRDDLEVERPHVAKGEAARWVARIDPRAFPRVDDPSLRPQSSAPPQEPAQTRGIGAWLVAALAGVLFAALVRTKWRAFARACTGRGVVARGFIHVVPPLGRAWLAGGALAAGIVAEAASLPVWGALGVIVAMFFASARALAPSVATVATRGPGLWLALSPAEAFAQNLESDPLDVATLAGKMTLLFAALASVALGRALGAIDCSWTWLAPLDAFALLPLFLTGSRAELPPDRVHSPKRRLASLHRTLKRDASVRVAPWARVPSGASAPDELRLLVLPRAPMPGVVGIEVGVAWIETPAGYAAETEVLVRVHDATAAAARMMAIGPRRHTVPGRNTDERVVRLVPALPSRAGTLALIVRLTQELRDRRKSLPGIEWAGSERRATSNLPSSRPAKPRGKTQVSAAA